MPQFISPNNSFGAIPFIVLGSTFVFTGTIWCLILAISSSLMTKKLKEKPSFSKILNRVTGIVFVGLGVKLLTSKAYN